jgi:hypothetical protein
LAAIREFDARSLQRALEGRQIFGLGPSKLTLEIEYDDGRHDRRSRELRHGHVHEPTSAAALDGGHYITLISRNSAPPASRPFIHGDRHR